MLSIWKTVENWGGLGKLLIWDRICGWYRLLGSTCDFTWKRSSQSRDAQVNVCSAQVALNIYYVILVDYSIFLFSNPGSLHLLMLWFCYFHFGFDGWEQFWWRRITSYKAVKWSQAKEFHAYQILENVSRNQDHLFYCDKCTKRGFNGMVARHVAEIRYWEQEHRRFAYAIVLTIQDLLELIFISYFLLGWYVAL